jgi:hypothetical protein
METILVILAVLAIVFFPFTMALLALPYVYIEGWLKYRKGLVWDAQNAEYVTIEEAEYRHALWLAERDE